MMFFGECSPLIGLKGNEISFRIADEKTGTAFEFSMTRDQALAISDRIKSVALLVPELKKKAEG